MARLLRLAPFAASLLALPLLLTSRSRPPQAAGDSYTVQAGETLDVPAFRGVLANDLDAEGEPLTAILDRPPMYGTLDPRPDGSFTYDRRINGGPDSFSYQAFDGLTRSTPVEAAIRVDAVPVAVADSWVTSLPDR
ncbi:MAG: Ig-like domain-containing protein [Acidimicrobiales bacterium]